MQAENLCTDCCSWQHFPQLPSWDVCPSFFCGIWKKQTKYPDISTSLWSLAKWHWSQVHFRENWIIFHKVWLHFKIFALSNSKIWENLLIFYSLTAHLCHDRVKVLRPKNNILSKYTRLLFIDNFGGRPYQYAYTSITIGVRHSICTYVWESQIVEQIVWLSTTVFC